MASYVLISLLSPSPWLVKELCYFLPIELQVDIMNFQTKTGAKASYPKNLAFLYNHRRKTNEIDSSGDENDYYILEGREDYYSEEEM